MKGCILTIPAAGKMTTQHVETAEIYLLLHKGVEGFIEQVPMFNLIEWQGAIRRCVAFCNDEGKLNGLPLNRRATDLWRMAADRPIADVLNGTVLVVWGDDEFMKEL